MIKLWNLRWADFPGLSGGTQCNHKSPFKGIDEIRRARVREGDVTMAAELGIIQILEEEATRQKCRQPLEAGKGEKRISP